MTNNFITLNGICKDYHSKDMPPFRALNDVSFSLPDRGLFFVIGRSGSGKSTLLNIVGGIDSPTEGSVAINGELIDYTDEGALNAYRSRMVGFVFQEFNLIEDFTIRDNVRLPLISDGTKIDENEIDSLLDTIGLAEMKDKTPSSLSGGERQRVAIIRALAKKPKILLADEPTGNLDTESSRMVFDLLKKLSLEMPIVVVTHDISSAYEYADRIIKLSKGEKVDDLEKNYQDDTGEIKREYESRLKGMFSKSDEKIESPKKTATLKKEGSMPFSAMKFIIASHLKKRVTSTILLIVIFALTLMGVGIVRTCAAFNGTTSLKNLIEKGNHRTIAVTRGEITEDNGIKYSSENLDFGEYASLAVTYGKAYKVYNCFYSFKSYIVEDEYVVRNNGYIYGICELEREIGESELDLFYGASLVSGSYPVLQDDCIEILISDKLADFLLTDGTVFNDAIVYPLSTYESLIGRVVTMESVDFKITGVYSTRYSDAITDNKDVEQGHRVFVDQFICPIAITNGGAIENQAKKQEAFFGSLSVIPEEISDLPVDYSAAFIPIDDMNKLSAVAEEYDVSFVLADEEKKTLQNNEILISYTLYCRIFNKHELNADGETVNAFDRITPESLEDLTISVELSDREIQEYKVIGVFEDVDEYGGVVVLNSFAYTKTINYSFDISAALISTENADLEKMIVELNGGDTVILLPENKNILQSDKWFSISKSTMEMFCALLVMFVVLIMYFIISRNIRDNRKSIGILRTFGVTTADLMKIYLLIDLIYFIFGYAFGVVLYFVGCNVVNRLMSSAIGLEIDFLIPDHISILLMLIVAVAALLISSIIPILRYTKQSPDQVIRRND